MLVSPLFDQIYFFCGLFQFKQRFDGVFDLLLNLFLTAMVLLHDPVDALVPVFILELFDLALNVADFIGCS